MNQQTADKIIGHIENNSQYGIPSYRFSILVTFINSLVSEDEFEAIGFCKTCSYFKQEFEWKPLGKCVYYKNVPPTSEGFACEEYELDDEYSGLDQQEE